MAIVAVDIGSTKARVGLAEFTSGGVAFTEMRDVQTAHHDLEKVLRAVANTAASLLAGAECDAIGISTAGFLHHDRATIDQLHDGRWTRTNVATPFEEALGKTPRVVDDGMAAGFSECLWGAARGCSSAVILTIGTKVGTAVLLDGRLLCVGGYASPQLGGVLIPLSSAREPSIPFIGEEAAGDALRSFAARYAYPDVTEMVACVHRDPAAAGALEHVCEYMSICVANAINLFAPDRVVLTGGVIEKSGSEIVPRVRERLRGKLLTRPNEFTAESALIAGRFGGLAGLYGAALAAFQDPAAIGINVA